jgi:hypothetical protein
MSPAAAMLYADICACFRGANAAPIDEIVSDIRRLGAAYDALSGSDQGLISLSLAMRSLSGTREPAEA